MGVRVGRCDVCDVCGHHVYMLYMLLIICGLSFFYLHNLIQGQTLLQLGRYGDVLGLTEDALDHTPLATCIHTLLASTHHTMGHQEKVFT